MPLESATYISQLVPTNPVSTDGIAAGDDHIRLAKSVLQTQFPNLGAAAVTGTAAAHSAAGLAFATAGLAEIANNGTVAGASMTLDGVSGTGTVAAAGKVTFTNTGTAGGAGGLGLSIETSPGTIVSAASLTGSTLSITGTLNAAAIQQGGNALVPAGVIWMWSGSVASIPAGFHLCDGTNGTPDLRNRFIAGAGSTYAPSQTGGAVSVTPTTNTAGSHTHGGTQAGGSVTPTGVTDTQGSHSHTGATAGHSLALSEMAAHDHGEGGLFVVSDASLGGTPTGQAIGAGPFPVSENQFQSQGSGAAHAHGINADGAHGHNLIVNALPAHTHAINADGSHSHTVAVATLPPFFALAYIMKL